MYFKVGRVLGAISGVITFVGAWWYCAASYGFLIGFGLGWFPAAILAALVALATMILWGLVAALGFGLLIWSLLDRDEKRVPISDNPPIIVPGSPAHDRN